MNQYVLRTNNLYKKYKEDYVLDDVNVEIKKGEIYGFIGQNGAGKTTLLRIVTGLAFPTKGDIELFGIFLGKALSQGCLIDIDLNPAFFKFMANKDPVRIEEIDLVLSQSLKDKEGLYGLNFTYPGIPSYELKENGEIAIADGVITEDFLKMKKEIVGASGKKVDILQSEKLGIIVEVVR